MANRIILKKIVHEDGREETSHDLIRSFLRKEAEKTFGEIKQFLEENGITYADNKGFDLALKSLIKKGDIGKHKIAGKSHPTYYIRKKSLNDISDLANEFRRMIIHKRNEFPDLPLEESEAKEGYFLRNIIHRYGIYTLFSQMQSWKFTSKEKLHAMNLDRRRTWLKNTVPSGIESVIFEDGITDLCGLRFYGTTEEFNQTISKMYENKQKWKKFLELEETLKKMYPMEMVFFEEMMTRSPKEAEVTKKFISDVERHEEWKRRIILKNKKNPKQSLKPNECPICHYDGTSKVKGGQAKGRIFPAGFVNEVTNEEGEHWHCPACGHWEIRKSS